jgi:SnoaL-like domain
MRLAIEAADIGDYDPPISLLSPDAVWNATGLGLFVYEGHAAIREFLEEWHEFFEEVRFTVEDRTSPSDARRIDIAKISAVALGVPASDEFRS